MIALSPLAFPGAIYDAHGRSLELKERLEPMTFNAWISAIEHVVTFDVDAEMWRKYFDAGLKPLEAIEQHRVDEEV